VWHVLGVLASCETISKIDGLIIDHPQTTKRGGTCAAAATAWQAPD
jgi:hypothetical protein